MDQSVEMLLKHAQEDIRDLDSLKAAATLIGQDRLSRRMTQIADTIRLLVKEVQQPGSAP